MPIDFILIDIQSEFLYEELSVMILLRVDFEVPMKIDYPV